MPKKKDKQTAKRKANPLPEMDKTRSDLSMARQGEDTYIARIDGPKIGNRAEWVKTAYANGVGYRELIKGSGLRTKQVLRLCGVDADIHPELVAELEAYRTNLLYHRD